MKKILLIGFSLLTACYSATTEVPPATATTAPRIIPTSVSATVTPTFPATLTPTTTHLPPERYFTEEFGSGLEYWSILFTSGDSSRVDIFNEDDTLNFELYDSNIWLYAIYGAFEYQTVHIETKVESRGSGTNTIGLVCHYNEQSGWYEFNISSDGSYNLLYGEWLAENIARYTPILNDESDRIETGNAFNEIGLDCYENILQIYINGKLIRKLDVSHIGLTGGKIGLSLASFEDAPVFFEYEWVKVGEP